MGQDTFFLTGTDEHAAKIVDAAAERGIATQDWADQNAEQFLQTFNRLQMSNDDFIRTSQDRHKTKVTQYVERLLDTGDVYIGQYEGWYDAGQEEYIPENKAKEYEYKSPINGKPLVRKQEDNYFFRLSAYSDKLLLLLDKGDEFDVQPVARRNEVIARIRDGLNDVPISRTGAGQWGIPVPGDDTHMIYVWIDALFNYLSTIDTADRQKYWPADVHFIAKDILWFHAVIWPAMLMALDRPLPRLVYAHSFWISEGQKMSKSLGNFIDLEKIDHYVETFSLDALRYFLASSGPMGTTDADFAESKFIDVYNSDLANAFGNCFSRIANMTVKYFGGKVPVLGPHVDVSDQYTKSAEQCIARYTLAMDTYQLDKACQCAVELIGQIDGYIESTQPFKLAKDERNLPQVGTILYHCTEAIRIASLMFWPFMPGKVEQLWHRIGCDEYINALADRGRGDLASWSVWGQLKPGTVIEKGESLFPRYQK